MHIGLPNILAPLYVFVFYTLHSIIIMNIVIHHQHGRKIRIKMKINKYSMLIMRYERVLVGKKYIISSVI